GCRAAAVVIGLTNHIAVLELAQGFDDDRLAYRPGNRQPVTHVQAAFRYGPGFHRLGEPPDRQQASQQNFYHHCSLDPGIRRLPGGLSDAVSEDQWPQIRSWVPAMF